MEEVYPVGNTHLPYYTDVMDHFEERGFSGEDDNILVVGGELIAWHMKDQYPDSFVQSIDIQDRTLELQSGIAERLSNGVNPETLINEVKNTDLMTGEDLGTMYPEIINELEGKVAEPDESYVQDFTAYEGDPDLILSNNVCDYTAGFMESVERADPDYLEMYTVFPVEDTLNEYSGSMEPEVNPDVDFWWVPDGGQEDVILFSDSY